VKRKKSKNWSKKENKSTKGKIRKKLKPRYSFKKSSKKIKMRYAIKRLINNINNLDQNWGKKFSVNEAILFEDGSFLLPMKPSPKLKIAMMIGIVEIINK